MNLYFILLHVQMEMFDSNEVGGWSTVGVMLDEKQSNKTTVVCQVSHLTSFAVLVSIQEGKKPVRMHAMRLLSLYDTTMHLHFSHLQLLTEHCQ